MQLVDEQDNLPLRRLDLLDHRLEAIFELSPVLRPRHQGAHVERAEALVLQRLRHVAPHDALGDSLDDGGLSHAGLADEHGVILRAPRQHLHDAPDLFVPADHGVNLPLPGAGGQVAAVLLEGLELPLRVLIGDPLTATHAGHRGEKLLVSDPPVLLQHAHQLFVVTGRREEVVLHGDEVVLELLGFVVGAPDHLQRPPREAGLGASARPGQRLDLTRDGRA